MRYDLIRSEPKSTSWGIAKSSFSWLWETNKQKITNDYQNPPYYKVVYGFILFLFVWNNDKKCAVFHVNSFVIRAPCAEGDQEDLLIISSSWQGHTEQGLTRKASSSHWAVFMCLIRAFPPHYTNTPSNRAWLSCESLLPTGMLSPEQQSSRLLFFLLPLVSSYLMVYAYSKAKGNSLQENLFCPRSCTPHS